MFQSRLAHLTEVLETRPGDPFIRFAIAMEYIKSGSDKQALSHLLELLESKPSYVGAYYHLGHVYERLKQTEEAVKIYRKGMDVARLQNDTHSLSELQQALMLAEGED